MDEKFIYVFSSEDKDYLLRNGFILIKKDEINHRYLFENKTNYQFSKNEMDDRIMVFSNRMMF